MTSVAHIWRHPIKSHGVEALDGVDVTVNACLPWDRHWAVAHEASETDGREWAPCVNFSRGAKAPKLVAIKAALDEASGAITLTHPDCAPLTFNPDTDPTPFLDWVAPLMPADRAQSARIIRVPGRGMTDTDYPSISLCNLASGAAVGERLSQSLSPLRWRGNIWLDGLEAWAENDWIGQHIRIGTAELEVRAPIKRCLATTSNPDTGERDADTLGALNDGWGHQNFGVYAVVTKPGRIALGDAAELL
ncbi:MOSC domain-containing protein [Aliiroseovarius sp. YM-037]|uniref:MOSC domain-containing protein n=1 Tax=Aliiroseovarius sp. YM-037 TaxID=3341728 RepID=UPI003A8113E2